jgi:hypothetical protein
MKQFRPFMKQFRPKFTNKTQYGLKLLFNSINLNILKCNYVVHNTQVNLFVFGLKFALNMWKKILSE